MITDEDRETIRQVADARQGDPLPTGWPWEQLQALARAALDLDERLRAVEGGAYQ